MEFETVIKDECGAVVYYLADISDDDFVDELLADHPEWYLSTVEVK